MRDYYWPVWAVCWAIFIAICCGWISAYAMVLIPLLIVGFASYVFFRYERSFRNRKRLRKAHKYCKNQEELREVIAEHRKYPLPPGMEIPEGFEITGTPRHQERHRKSEELLAEYKRRGLL